MKTKLRVYAVIGLYIAGVAATVTIALRIILGEFSLPVQISLAITVLGLAAFMFMKPESVRQFLTGRQAKYGSNSLVMIIATLGILIVVNLLSINNTVRWDLTEDKQNTLASETLDTLKSLPSPVFAQAFFTSRISSEIARTTLQNYKANSNGNFDFEFIDPDADPVAANKAGIQTDGTIVLTMENKQELITRVTENEITSALIKLMHPGERVIYALTGHGERNFLTSSELSYKQVRDTLVLKNYTVNELNLISTKTIPTDALAIIIAGPQKQLSTEEVTLLKDYLAQGGSLVILYDPSVLTQFGEEPDPLAELLSSEWGLIFGDDLIIDLTADPPSVAVAASYTQHPITEKLEGMVAILPSARSVQLSAENPKNAITLASTTDQSWAETDIASLENNQVTFDQQADLMGPIPLAVAIEDHTTGSRIVAFGDSDFADDSYYKSYGNGDFITNAIDWAAGQDNLISLTPRTQTNRLLIAPQKYVQSAIMFGSIFAIPGIIIISAVIIFIQRKREI